MLGFREEGSWAEGFLVCQFWLSEGSPELDPWVEESVCPTVFSLLTTSCEEMSFLEEQPGYYP